jgi:2',3'-cyclic-nucleotide 2'-phosphodiesterase (5'-nucleotidase family)
LDAGNLFFKQENIDPGIPLDVSKENARTIVNSFNHITCDAFSPGAKDFGAGLDFFNKLREESNFEYISCNIQKVDKELLLQPYKIIQSEDFSIGVIGASSFFQEKGIYVEDPFTAIRNTAKDLEIRCDFIVLLFSSSDADYTKLNTVSDNLGVDFIVRGNTRRKSTDGGKGAVPIYSTGDRGKILYQFDLKCKDKVSPLIDIALYEKSIKTDQKRINRLGDTSESADKILSYKQNIQLSNSAIEKAQNTLQFKSITLSKLIADNPYVLKIVDAGKSKVIDMGGPSILDPHHGHKH